MKAPWYAAAALGVLAMAPAPQAPAIRITTPAADAIVTGSTRLEATVTPPEAVAAIERVTFFVDGSIVCTVEQPPFACNWNAGDVVRGHHVRVVANRSGGVPRLIDNLRTRDPGFTDKVNADAVLVPVIVTEHGRFVRGLKAVDFELTEDSTPQRIASLVSDDVPLDLVLAIDISGSMEAALDNVKSAVKQLLGKLRPDDAATVMGFNDTLFTVTDRERDPRAREAGVDLLTSHGGTALYDATIRTLDLVSRDFGRKGVVIFSDGDDRHSLARRETALARVQSSDAMLYTIGFGGGATVPALRNSLEGYARSTGGRAFFPKQTKELDGVFDEIVGELSNQYVLSYVSTNQKQDRSLRHIDVKVKKGKYEVRARTGYRLRTAS